MKQYWEKHALRGKKNLEAIQVWFFDVKPQRNMAAIKSINGGT